MLGKESSVRLIISMIFNQSHKSGKAFLVPSELQKRLELDRLDTVQLEEFGYDALYEAINKTPCLHRFPSTMAKYLYASIVMINDEYSSDPRNIWKGKDEGDTLTALMKLSGIGNHKAVQCLIILHHIGEIEKISDSYYEYMARTCAHFLENIDSDIKLII